MTHTIVSPVMSTGKKSFKIRTNKIKSTCKKLQHQLNNKVEIALLVCDPNHSIHHSTNKECEIVWKEIERISNTIHDMNKAMYYLDDDWESFIELECKV
tara:strand:- start:576 stop:872 length:297 start_codon:yes stop_codon:yes gene_type:complete